MDFGCLYAHGFARVAACTGPLALADPMANAESVVRAAGACAAEGVAVAVFPELFLTGYSVEDLVLQDALLDAVDDAVAMVLSRTVDLLPVLVVGAPLRHRDRVYNCAVVMHRGRPLGVVPKSYLPNYREFYEHRQIAPAEDAGADIRRRPSWTSVRRRA